MGINLLQYNVDRQHPVQDALLADPETNQFDIIALQEPALKSGTQRLQCSRAAKFWPMEGWNGWTTGMTEEERRPRVAFFINKDLDSSKWQASYCSRDLVQVTLKTPSGRIQVINIYCKPKEHHAARLSTTSLLQQIQEVADKEADIALIGDMNMHHPNWGGQTVEHAHNAAWDLIAISEELGLELATPDGLVTRQRANNRDSTLDLTFLSPGLYERLLRCNTIESADKGSDHKPIWTRIGGPTVRKERWKWSWKDVDSEAISLDAEALLLPGAFTGRSEVEEYAEYLSDFVCQLAYKHGKRVRCKNGGKTWWSPRVKAAVEAYRTTSRNPHLYSEEERRQARSHRNREVKLAKAGSFRGLMDSARADTKLLWRMAKWGRTASSSPPSPPAIPSLVTSHGPDGTAMVAKSLDEKADALREQFFPAPTPIEGMEPSIDVPEILAELPTAANQPQGKNSPPNASIEDVIRVIADVASDKAPGHSGVTNRFLKMMGHPLAKAIAALTSGCWQWEHYPSVFKLAKTVVLWKAGKSDYQTPKAWRPIALLDTVGKVIEAVTAHRIRQLAEEEGMLPDQQMGARKGRSTESAVAMLLAQIRTVWEEPDAVASVLSLDISGAFDRVQKERLYEILRKRGIPRYLAGFVLSFMSGRRTTLQLGEEETKAFEVLMGIPQGSSLSPILFLFYNAELLEVCQEPGKVSNIGFVDDVNLITWGPTTEGNCQQLARIHVKAEEWAGRHGMIFAPEKYSLMHFSRRRLVNLAAELRLGDLHIKPSEVMRILECIWIPSCAGRGNWMPFQGRCSHSSRP